MGSKGEPNKLEGELALVSVDAEASISKTVSCSDGIRIRMCSRKFPSLPGALFIGVVRESE